MALTNEQITAQNFKDFYGQIRPYLNGNVPTFANTFNKSDLYSTDERLVGRWIDGKPLYQKTINFGSCPNATAKEVSLNIANIEKIVFYNGFMLSADFATSIPLPNVADTTYQAILVLNRNFIRITTFVDRSSFNGYITIQYTKTTDSSMSVTDGNEYSTDEQVVGHWIDGKPLFQRTYVTNLSLPLNNVQVNFGDISDINMDYGTITEIAFCEDDYWVNQGDIALWIRKPNNNFGARCTMSNVSRNGTCYFTIRYTKL